MPTTRRFLYDNLNWTSRRGTNKASRSSVFTALSPTDGDFKDLLGQANSGFGIWNYALFLPKFHCQFHWIEYYCGVFLLKRYKIIARCNGCYKPILTLLGGIHNRQTGTHKLNYTAERDNGNRWLVGYHRRKNDIGWGIQRSQSDVGINGNEK